MSVYFKTMMGVLESRLGHPNPDKQSFSQSFPP